MTSLESKDSFLPASILVVEDDENILNLLSAYLNNAGYSVITASNGSDGLAQVLGREFDMCVLDVMLPYKSGVEIAAAMQDAGCDTPILFLTALGNESDILRGFGVGADDYIVKPFSPRVLLARISAILKRVPSKPTGVVATINEGPIKIDDNQPLCQVNGKHIELTPHEYRILRQLLKRPEQVFARSALIAAIYGNDDAVSPKAIDVHVHHLRSKLGGTVGDMIKTVRGFGYKYSPVKSTSS